MKTVILLFSLFVTALTQATDIIPTTRPTVTSNEGFWCATGYLPQDFDPPRPAGALHTALLSYGKEILKKNPCALSGTARLDCPLPSPSDWCAFSTAAPTSVLPKWSSHGSIVSSWWSAHSSSASEVAERCPLAWADLMLRLQGRTGLYNAIVWGHCYTEAKATEPGISSTTTASPGSTRSGATSESTSKDQPTRTEDVGNVETGADATGGGPGIKAESHLLALGMLLSVLILIL